MNKLKLSIPLALGSLFLAGNLAHAAETTPATPPPSAPAPDLDQRMRQLEDRIHSLETRNRELESQLENRRPDNDTTLRQFRDRMKRDFSNNFDDLFDQMRREMEQGGMNFQFGPNGQLVPPNFGGPNFGTPMNEKPRLGVQLSPITDQLRERYKNDAKQGAFVLAVVPDSAAEKAGMQVGDAITKVDGKDVATPDAAIEAIRNAPAGKLDITILRQNKEQTLKPELQAEESVEETLPPTGANRWLRRGDLNRGGGMSGSGANNGGTANLNNGNVQMQTELKASALELPDDLAKTLKLSDDQRKKMGDILQKQAHAASDEAAAENQPRTNARGGMRGFSLRTGGDVSRIVDKHVIEAEGELKSVLSDEQMREWKDWRKTHNTVEFSHSMRIESGDAAPNNTSSGGTLGF